MWFHRFLAISGFCIVCSAQAESLNTQCLEHFSSTAQAECSDVSMGLSNTGATLNPAILAGALLRGIRMLNGSHDVADQEFKLGSSKTSDSALHINLQSSSSHFGVRLAYDF